MTNHPFCIVRGISRLFYEINEHSGKVSDLTTKQCHKLAAWQQLPESKTGKEVRAKLEAIFAELKVLRAKFAK